MICKGCYKNIIFLKNTGSDLFEEAYLIINDSNTKTNLLTESEMIDQANRIVSESLVRDCGRQPANKNDKPASTGKPIAFLLGFAAGLILSLCVMLIK